MLQAVGSIAVLTLYACDERRVYERLAAGIGTLLFVCEDARFDGGCGC